MFCEMELIFRKELYFCQDFPLFPPQTGLCLHALSNTCTANMAVLKLCAFAGKIVCIREFSGVACSLALLSTVSPSQFQLTGSSGHDNHTVYLQACSEAGGMGHQLLCLHQHFQLEFSNTFILISTTLSDAFPGKMERDMCNFPQCIRSIFHVYKALYFNFCKALPEKKCFSFCSCQRMSHLKVCWFSKP